MRTKSCSSTPLHIHTRFTYLHRPQSKNRSRTCDHEFCHISNHTFLTSFTKCAFHNRFNQLSIRSSADVHQYRHCQSVDFLLDLLRVRQIVTYADRGDTVVKSVCGIIRRVPACDSERPVPIQPEDLGDQVSFQHLLKNRGYPRSQSPQFATCFPLRILEM